MGRESVGTAVLAVLLAVFGAVPAVASAPGRSPSTSDTRPDPRMNADADRVAEPARAPELTGSEEPIATIRPEALITTATVLALAMGVTGVATAMRARRRAGD